MLLNVEQQIATFGDREKILPLRHRFQQRVVGGHDVRPAAADAVRIRPVAALGDQRAGRDDVLARRFAIKSDLHDAARPQQRQQNPPAGPRIGEMMQDAGRVDEIELSPERAQHHDVGLRELDVGGVEIFRHALGVAQACEAEIDRQDARVAHLPRKLDGRQPGAATGDQDIGNLFGRRVLEDRRLYRRAGLDPARVGVLLVLLAHRPRHLAFDRRQGGDGRGDLALAHRFLDLLHEQIVDIIRPRPFQQCIRPSGRVQRKIGADGDRPQRRHRLAGFERLRQFRLQIARALRLALRQGVNVFVDETLPRHGGKEFQAALRRRLGRCLRRRSA